MVERAIHTLRKPCAHRHRSGSLRRAMRAIGDWIAFCNHRRPRHAPG
ncbi:hypothetical protein [Rhodanobacter aciditrophus]